MKRAVLLAITLTTILACRATDGLAEEAAQRTPAAAAPAQNGGKAVETTGGCLPGGACCGDPACAQAGPSGEKPAAGQATGGCPCAKMKKKEM